MNIQKISEQLDLVNTNISNGEFDAAWKIAKNLYVKIEKLKRDQSDIKYTCLGNLAGYCVDVGHQIEDAAKLGFRLMDVHKNKFVKLYGDDIYYYNLANARGGVNDRKKNITFESIEGLVLTKNDYWRSIKIRAKSGGNLHLECMVNLALNLKRQHRIVEAINCFDQVIRVTGNVPEALRGRAFALEELNSISGGNYSVDLLHQIVEGLTQAKQSPLAYEKLKLSDQKRIDYYNDCIEDEVGSEIDELERIHDKEITAQEFDQLSDFRKFCLQKSLVLSEHGLYCGCNGSKHDDLSIPNSNNKSQQSHVENQEIILNRIKSEYFFARQLYYECKEKMDVSDMECETRFSMKTNAELWGSDPEKLRLSFKMCSSILDKIAVAIVHEYKILKLKNQEIYFHNFWRLDVDDRRQEFEKNKTKGLLALYSIATDLNSHKKGEYSFFRDWRNCLEHNFFVITPNSNQPSTPGSNICVGRDELLKNLQLMLQLTRSAIFSYVFSIRETAFKDQEVMS